MHSKGKVAHTTGVYIQYSFQCKVVWIHLGHTSTTVTVGPTRPTVFLPYPRRLQSLTVFRCHSADFLLSYLKTLTVGQARELNPQTPAQQTGTLPTELTRLLRLQNLEHCYLIIEMLTNLVRVLDTHFGPKSTANLAILYYSSQFEFLLLRKAT